MDPEADDRAAPDVEAPGLGRPMVAHLIGGPFDGQEFVLYRARRHYARRVRRGPFRRVLGSGPRYAWYERERSWADDGLDHGDYHYVGLGGRHRLASAA
jgi:hypothetical protein